ncbi:Transcriptional adapter ada2 [Phlyctochytrium planicorne]|nr:Transcriptional adapter ada2 [Phlyctochytrium planicorne]
MADMELDLLMMNVVQRKRSSEDALLQTPAAEDPSCRRRAMPSILASAEENFEDAEESFKDGHSPNAKKRRLVIPSNCLAEQREDGNMESVNSEYPSPTSPTSLRSQMHPFHIPPAATETSLAKMIHALENDIANSSPARTRIDPRKSSAPLKSPHTKGLSKDEKDVMGIVRLDVFKTYCQRPRLLLVEPKVQRAELKERRRSLNLSTGPSNTSASFRQAALRSERSTAAGSFTTSNSTDASSVMTRKRRSSGAAKPQGGSQATNVPQSPTPGSYKPVTRQTSGDFKLPSDKHVSGQSSNTASREKINVNTTREHYRPAGKDTGAPITPISPDLVKSYTSIDVKETNYTVTWSKNVPLKISPSDEGYEKLQPDEVTVCSTLRLPPNVYLSIKETLLSARHEKGTFKKREAQRWCRVDVNKTGKIFDWFVAKGWLLLPPPGRNTGGSRRDDD